MNLIYYLLKISISLTFFFTFLVGIEAFLDSGLGTHFLNDPLSILILVLVLLSTLLGIIYFSKRFVAINPILFNSLRATSRFILLWFSFCFLACLIFCFDFSLSFISQAICFFLWPVEIIYMQLPDFVLMDMEPLYLFLYLVTFFICFCTFSFFLKAKR